MALKTQGIAILLLLGCLVAAGILASQPDAVPSGAAFADSGQALGNSLSYAAAAGDVDGDGDVDFEDLLQLLGKWGECPNPPDGCPADLNCDGQVGFDDLLIVLDNWS